MWQHQSGAEVRGAIRQGVVDAIRQQFDIPEELAPALARLSKILENREAKFRSTP